jgi:glycosyltransferase involved in cell wall biosynthesis
LIVPSFDRHGVGEDYSNYKWIEGLATRNEVTVLSIEKRNLPERLGKVGAELVELEDSAINLALMRLSKRYRLALRTFKHDYVPFYFKSRRWIQTNGARFDLIHQISPLALRYPSPATGYARRTGTPFLVGPLAGSLSTPRPLRRTTLLPEMRGWCDRLRFRLDPWLRSTYQSATCLMGAAPYVRELLHSMDLKRFEVMAETGSAAVWDGEVAPPAKGQLELLFVGRLTRTKGVLHAIRSMQHLRDCPGVRLRIIGDGELYPQCVREIDRLGLGGTVEMVGRIARKAVFEYYKRSHVFFFPSYREPSGNVVFESMSFGLPVVTTSVGGPAHVVTDECGFLIDPCSPGEFEAELARVVRQLLEHPELRSRMGRAARRRIEETALWPWKIDLMCNLYDELDTSPAGSRVVSHETCT